LSRVFWICVVIFAAARAVGDEIPRGLRVGRAGHAFDHVGGISAQAETAAASGATIIYATGLGGFGYMGLPPADALAAERKAVAQYNRKAKAAGIELSIGYLCATSMVKLDTFDKNWTNEFRSQFKTPPAEWRQQDRQGKPLASWYGGDYTPACMNNPDWCAYEQAMVREQIEAGHDGIFFDNPTVHPQGCYCQHCMEKFGVFLLEHNVPAPEVARAEWLDVTRKLADDHPKEFLQFRTTTARDFLTNMRQSARVINPCALVTCNNSLNTPAALYSQCRNYGYSIDELSKAEDFVVVEDMATQPRVEANGQTVEYGPTYKQLHAISHGKPIVAVTLVSGDYHTAPNLMRLAMAEAAANGASYLSWPTWPEEQRTRMAAAVRPQADLLRRNEALLNDAPFRADVVLYLPMNRWLETDSCEASNLAAALSASNVQYQVVAEGELAEFLPTKHRPVLVVESMSVLTAGEKAVVEKYGQGGKHLIVADKPDWLEHVRKAIARTSIRVHGPRGVRAVVRDQPGRTIVHLYNLNVQRLTSFEDKVMPADTVKLEVAVPFSVRAVNLQTADENQTAGQLQFTTQAIEFGTLVSTTIKREDISAIITIEK
jgi:hypothetical protein